MGLGKRLAKARERAGFKTQKDAAKAVGISLSVLNRYEKEVNRPDWEMLAQIAKVYDVSVDYLVGNIDTFNWPTKKDEQNSDLDIDVANFLVLVPSAEDREELVPVSEELREKIAIAVKEYRRERKAAIQRGEWPPTGNGRS